MGKGERGGAIPFIGGTLYRYPSSGGGVQLHLVFDPFFVWDSYYSTSCRTNVKTFWK